MEQINYSANGPIRGSVPLDNMSTIQNNQDQQMAREQARRAAQLAEQQRITTANSYRDATDANGNVDRGVLMSRLAQGGAGATIPGAMKGFLDNDKTSAETDNKKVDTSAKNVEVLYKGLKMSDDAIAGLLAKPDANERDVYSEMGRLVRVGAFDAQAAHKGISPDQFAKEILSTMPVGNPPELRNWLMQTGARTMDATKRLEMAQPQFSAQDQGGVINNGTIDTRTGIRTPGAPDTNTVKTPTPGEVLTDQRGRDLNAQAKRTNDIQQEANNNQLVETPQGYQLINKGTHLSVPVNTATGQPVLGAKSPFAENAQMADRLTSQIATARQLIPNATASSGGALIDKVGSMVGISTKGADAAAALDTLGGWMTSNVPRMQGPQSDNDVKIYKQMAGMVGDRNIPMSQRLAALDVLDGIITRFRGQPGTASPATIPPGGRAPQGGTVPAPRPMVTPQGGAPGQLPDINSFFRG